jgi:hypothetical protein
MRGGVVVLLILRDVLRRRRALVTPHGIYLSAVGADDFAFFVFHHISGSSMNTPNSAPLRWMNAT